MSGQAFAEDPRAAAGSPRYRRALVALFCAALATFAQIYAPQGLLPEIARDFNISASTSSLAIGATTLGLAVGMRPWVASWLAIRSVACSVACFRGG